MRAARRGPDTVIAELAGTEPWRPRVLSPAAGLARMALVQSRASLLGGDEIGLEIELGAGCELELLELGATVAHHARRGPPARLAARIRLGPGARLIWLGQPLIAAAGCDVVRSTQIELDAGAGVLLGDSLVLGRDGEQPGRASVHTRITLEGRPVLEETLETAPGWLLRSLVVAGRARMVAALTLAGLRDPAPPPGALQSHEPATLWRSTGAARAGVQDINGELTRRWRALVLGAGAGPPSSDGRPDRPVDGG